mmetsp:Transcript_1511/g.4106  ORF Transcript_1511/g.4106 Transcript_1511/m.4106 type:complete len:228 (+) Transcript_1511:731-1414(+)
MVHPRRRDGARAFSGLYYHRYRRGRSSAPPQLQRLLRYPPHLHHILRTPPRPRAPLLVLFYRPRRAVLSGAHVPRNLRPEAPDARGDRDEPPLRRGGAADEEKTLSLQAGAVPLPQLPLPLPVGVAPLHHLLQPRGGDRGRPHPLRRRLDQGPARPHRPAPGGHPDYPLSDPRTGQQESPPAHRRPVRRRLGGHIRLQGRTPRRCWDRCHALLLHPEDNLPPPQEVP